LPRDPPESRRQDDPDDFPNTREHEKSAQQKDIPLVPDPKSEVMQRLHNAVTLSNGLRSFEYAEAEYKEYAHSGFIQSKFPDAFKDKQDFIAEFLNGDHVAVSDWASIKNTSASEQPEGDYPSLFKKFWEFQGTKWAEKGVDDKTNEERFKTYLDGLIEKADAEDEETTPPVIVGVHRDPTLGTETSWLLAGNSRALLYAFIGKAAPTRMVPLKGRMLPDPTEEELQTVLWPAESSSEDDDELEQNVRAAVQQVIAGRGGQPPGGSPPPPEAAVPPAPAAAPPAAAPPEAAAPPQEAVLRVLKTIFESEYKHPSGHTKRLFSKAFKTLGYPVGTVRNWARGKVIKTRDGWEEVPAGTKAPKIATPLVPAAQHDQPRPKLALKRAAAAPPVANLPARDSDEAHWIEAIPDFPAETTQKHYGPNRAPKAYRQKLHNSIISKYFDKVPAPSAETLRTKKPVAIMLMGGPASGKSTIGGAYPDTQFIHLDADALKEHLPEYKVATKWRAKNAAKMTHEESIHLMQQLREKTISARKNLVMDGTGRHVTSYLNMITKLKTAGYHVKVVLADIDQDLARKRAKIRAQSGGRWVPPHVFDAAYAAVPKNFAEIASAAHEFELWDTRPEGEPQLKWEKTGGEEHIHDPVFVERFQKQYVREPNRGAVYPPHKRRPVSFVPSKQTKAEAVAALKNIFVLG
jgi:predicted ABC-type ATPase